MRSFKKRGLEASTLTILAIGGIVIAAFVFIVMPMVTKAFASGKISLKVAAARDIALILDTMYAYPYDMELEYDFDLRDLTIKIIENQVEVDLVTLTVDPTTSKYSFVPINDKPNYILEGPEKIFFKKEDGKIKCDYIQKGILIEC